MTSGCPGTNPGAWLAWPELELELELAEFEEVVMTLPPGPKVVCTGVW